MLLPRCVKLKRCSSPNPSLYKISVPLGTHRMTSANQSKVLGTIEESAVNECIEESPIEDWFCFRGDAGEY